MFSEQEKSIVMGYVVEDESSITSTTPTTTTGEPNVSGKDNEKVLELALTLVDTLRTQVSDLRDVVKT